MAQGQIKKSAAAKNISRSQGGSTQKGLGVKKSKKQNLIKAAKINKKFTSGLTAQTERMLGERAGHLEMIGKGRKKDTTQPLHGKKGGEKRTGKKPWGSVYRFNTKCDQSILRSKYNTCKNCIHQNTGKSVLHTELRAGVVRNASTQTTDRRCWCFCTCATIKHRRWPRQHEYFCYSCSHALTTLEARRTQLAHFWKRFPKLHIISTGRGCL